MKKTLLIISVACLVIPAAVSAYTADDFTVNQHSTYAVPPGTTKLLILDLTSPEPIDSIKIKNAGTAQQTDLSKISIYKDGSSPGWDGDETEFFSKSSSPFWETWLSGPSQTRIFVTVDINSSAVSERTIKPQLEINSVKFTPGESGPSDRAITGFEREILAVAGLPTIPVSPSAGTPEALSASTIRWHFTDMSNNEFGFKILDGNLNELVRKEQADISYIDETGLEPDTEYSGRRIVAFNDRGESSITSLSIFKPARTLALPEIEVVPEKEEEEEGEEVVEIVPEKKPEPELTTAEQLRAKIRELQLKLIELLNQLIELLQQQLSGA